MSEWKSVKIHGLPPCDGEKVFVGINSAGYACCFTDTIMARRQTVSCLYDTAENSEVMMSDLAMYRELDYPENGKIEV